MNVSDILTLMATLSIGGENLTDTERSIFLSYLNLAHFDLYAATANLNQNLLTVETLANEEGSNSIELPQTPFLIDKAYIASLQKTLIQRSLADILKTDPDLSQEGQPQSFYRRNNVVQFYPSQTISYDTTIWYVPSPTPFTKDTLEADIPYPPAYHPVLADGALSYVFQDDGGFKNSQREYEAKRRWERGKSRLLSYLYYSNRFNSQRLGTLKNVTTRHL